MNHIANSLSNILETSNCEKPTKVDYSRIKGLSSRNSAEIMYVHMV